MQVKSGYKQTEVGVIPEEWKVLPITEVTNAIFLGLTSKVDYVSSGGIPLVRATDIADGHLSFAAARAISLRQHRELTKYRRAKRGDVLVSKSGSLGVCAIVDVDTEFSIYESIIVLQPNHLLDSLFLLWLLRYEATQSRMIGDRVGSSVGHLNLEMFRKLIGPIPLLPEQRAIAGALGDVDALLGALERLIDKKRDLKQAAMQQLLTGQKRLPGFTGEWEVKRLGDIATIRDGTHQTPKYVPSGIPFYSVEQVTSGDFTSTKFISEKEHRFLTRSFKIEKGDILMTRIGSIGDCKLLDWEVDASFYVSLALLKIQPGHSAAYIAHYSNTASFKKEVELHSLQSAIPKKINLGPISNIRIEMPPFAEQTAIAEVLSDLDAEIAAMEQRRDKTRALKQGMMQELLTGKTRLV